MSDALRLSQSQVMEQLLEQLEIDEETGTVSANGVVLLERVDEAGLFGNDVPDRGARQAS